MKLTAAVPERWHNTWLAVGLTVGIGFTVMSKDMGDPVQVNPVPVKAGVAVMVAVTGAFVVFSAVKAAMSPVPVAARPMEALLFDHV